MKDEFMERSEEILKARAAELAKRIDNEDEDREALTLLEFITMGQRFAVHLNCVTSVVRISEITSIPLVPKHITGIIRRRGDSIALVNLMRFFRQDQTGISDADFAVIVTGGGKHFALQAEDVLGVVLVPSVTLQPPQENFDKVQQPYISGVTLDGLILLDLDRLVDAKGFVAEKSTV